MPTRRSHRSDPPSSAVGGDRRPVARDSLVTEHNGWTLKLELLQHAGLFKRRGAFNRVLSEPTSAAAGLIAAGTHGAALAYVGQQLGLRVEQLHVAVHEARQDRSASEPLSPS